MAIRQITWSISCMSTQFQWTEQIYRYCKLTFHRPSYCWINNAKLNYIMYEPEWTRFDGHVCCYSRYDRWLIVTFLISIISMQIVCWWDRWFIVTLLISINVHVYLFVDRTGGSSSHYLSLLFLCRVFVDGTGGSSSHYLSLLMSMYICLLMGQVVHRHITYLYYFYADCLLMGQVVHRHITYLY